MMKVMKFAMAFAFVLITSLSALQAQDVIQPKDLIKIMNKPTTVIVSARTADDYKQVHVTKAVHVDHNDLYGDNTMLLPAAEIAKKLGAKGISESKKIVLYDEGSQKYSGRMYWILKYLGAKDVVILNGGMPAWKAARKPVTRSVPPVKATTFNVSINPKYLANMGEVKKATGSSSYIIVDARTPEEFNGTKDDATLNRTGHIPSAVNINYETLLNNGKLKSNDEIQAIFSKNGVSKDKTVIVYCKTSVRAGILFHTLTSALEYPNVKVYDGAYLEWQKSSSNEIGR
ncbi:MAG: sulfurtransferase [Bacteroidota bacterium]